VVALAKAGVRRQLLAQSLIEPDALEQVVGRGGDWARNERQPDGS
jgi:hypothetical protein